MYPLQTYGIVLNVDAFSSSVMFLMMIGVIVRSSRTHSTGELKRCAHYSYVGLF